MLAVRALRSSSVRCATRHDAAGPPTKRSAARRRAPTIEAEAGAAMRCSCWSRRCPAARSRRAARAAASSSSPSTACRRTRASIPGKGASAIHELAQQIVAISELQDLTAGSASTSAGSPAVRGRTSSPTARASIDVRVPTMADAARRRAGAASAAPRLRGTRLEIHGRVERPPLERDAAVSFVSTSRPAKLPATRASWGKAGPAAGRTGISRPR